MSGLSTLLRRCGKICVAYSGGADSLTLLAAAQEILGKEKVLAITVNSILEPYKHNKQSDLPETLGVRHILLDAKPLDIPEVRTNRKDRCYHCKKYIFSMIKTAAHEYGFDIICDGTNADDAKTYRPGIKAARELDVISPFLETGMTKAEILNLAEESGLHNRIKPSSPCLLTRIPYNQTVTPQTLAQISAAEDILKEQGFSVCRVRHHGELARIEIPKTEFTAFLDNTEITDRLKTLGYSHITLDIEGITSGCFDNLDKTLEDGVFKNGEKGVFD